MSIMEVKIKSWLSSHAHWLVFWVGVVVLCLSLLFAPFSRRSLTASAATTNNNYGYSFSNYTFLFSDLGDSLVDQRTTKFGFSTPVVAGRDEGPFAALFGFTGEKFTSSYSAYYHGSSLIAVTTAYPYGCGWFRYSSSIHSSSFAVQYGSSSFASVYPQDAAIASSLDTLPSDVVSSSYPSFVYLGGTFADTFSAALTEGHSYTINIFCSNSSSVVSSSDLYPLFSGRDMVWDGSSGFVSSGPGTWYKPSFVADNISSSLVAYVFPYITPTSFFDTTDGKYVFPFSVLETPLDPVPPSPPGDDDYQAGYNAGYDAGYSDGFNKGQTSQFVSPLTQAFEPVKTFLDTNLFGSFSLGDFFTVAVFVMLALIFLKMFGGG